MASTDRMPKPRQCKRCGADLEIGTHRLLCDACRAIPDQRCKRCKKVKPVSAFSHDKTRPSGVFPWCKACQNEYNKGTAFQDETLPPNGRICPVCDTPIRGHANRKFCSNGCKDKVGRLKKKFNLTIQQFREMVDATGGHCPICGDRPTSWQVDHNHDTGEVTGVVCIRCNIGLLAYSKHSVEYASNLLDYLTETPAHRLGIHAIAAEEPPPQLHKRWGHRNRTLRGGSS